jgi:hypothetical protein
MRNHTAVAKGVVAASCTLAIALLTIGMGGNSTWAGSDVTLAMPATSISSEVVQPSTTPNDSNPSIHQLTPGPINYTPYHRIRPATSTHGPVPATRLAQGITCEQRLCNPQVAGSCSNFGPNYHCCCTTCLGSSPPGLFFYCTTLSGCAHPEACR